MLSGGIRSGWARARMRRDFIQRTTAGARCAAGAPPWCVSDEPSPCAARFPFPVRAA
ncbi:MAG: twin-arginine translocation signal domain-containing protein [Burkholderiales bacterium]|nr:MAG: twin-arginine translocation signal domain-containing protein [Burkholderiales bacterium]